MKLSLGLECECVPLPAFDGHRAIGPGIKGSTHGTIVGSMQ